VLAHADGAAWVRAALVRDLVCCTSCSTCSFISCWALTCSACASIAAWSSKTKVFLWPARRPLRHCFLRLSLSPFHLLLLMLLLRREGVGGGAGKRPGGPLVACDLQRPNPKYLGLARTVYIYTVYDRIFNDFTAKNTVYTPYIYMVLANPKNTVFTPIPHNPTGSKKTNI